VGGSLVRTSINDDKHSAHMELILGLFMRMDDAIIGAAGLQVGPVQFMANYDFTMSALSPYNAAYGALEFSLIYQENIIAAREARELIAVRDSFNKVFYNR